MTQLVGAPQIDEVTGRGLNQYHHAHVNLDSPDTVRAHDYRWHDDAQPRQRTAKPPNPERDIAARRANQYPCLGTQILTMKSLDGQCGRVTRHSRTAVRRPS